MFLSRRFSGLERHQRRLEKVLALERAAAVQAPARAVPTMATNHLREIEAQGQAIWLDNISRALLEDGDAASASSRRTALSGVTSNPTIFEKAIGDSDRYDEALRERAARGPRRPREIFFDARLSGHPRRRATCCGRSSSATEGKDGYVSFELPPELADDAEGSVEAGQALPRARSTGPTC